MTTRRQQGYAAGRDDALASRLDRPDRYRDDSFREGYVAGYEAHRPVQVRQAFLVSCAWNYDYSLRLVTSFSDGHENIWYAWVKDDRWHTEGGWPNHPDWQSRRRLLTAWARRFWSAHPADFRGLAIENVRYRHPKFGHRNAFQDYLDENNHPLADFLRCAWTTDSWPLHPIRLPGLPHADFHPAHVLSRRHWVCRNHAGSAWQDGGLWDLPCGHTSTLLHDHELGQDGLPLDRLDVPPCPTCYRIRALPGCGPIKWEDS